MASGWLQQVADIRDIKLITVGISLFFAFGVIVLGLFKEVLIISPLLFYIPILVASYWFPKKAVFFAVFVGAINIIIVYIYSFPDVKGLTYTTATASFYVLVALSLIISSLTQTMRDKEARYHGVFDHSEVGIILLKANPDTLTIDEINSRGMEILGLDPSRQNCSQSSCSVARIIPDPSVIDQIRNNKGFFMTESVLLRNDGTTVPVLISGAQMPEDMIVLNVTDISERKKAEDQLQKSLAEKNILIREVHHRVKNNMQVISGLLELQSRQITDPETRHFFVENQNRIKTMALIHESLYRSDDFVQIDFSAYLNELIADLLVSYGWNREKVSVDIQLEVTHIGMDIAVPCGLIANELLSNTLKHAFPGNRMGHIRIRLVHASGKGYEFTVSDDGIGLPAGFDFRNARTFGLQLINGLATHQMRGTVELQPGPGTSFVIRFPDAE